MRPKADPLTDTFLPVADILFSVFSGEPVVHPIWWRATASPMNTWKSSRPSSPDPLLGTAAICRDGQLFEKLDDRNRLHFSYRASSCRWYSTLGENTLP